MFESHLYGYLSTGNGFCCVIVTATAFMLIDIMSESQLNDYWCIGKEFHCVMVIAIDFMLVNTIF